MDAKDLRTEASLGERSSDGSSKYTHVGNALPCSGKSYHDVSSNPLAKMDTPTSRPCAVIGPDRVLPPTTHSDAYLKKTHYEPWPPTENTYRPPEYPHKMPSYQCPIRNISPRQTYQENMQRIMVPPTYNSIKINEDANFVLERNAALAKSNKLVGPAESKYCDVPYSVNSLSDNHKNTEMCVSNANSTRNCPPGTVQWHPGGVNIRPARPYGAPELYQFPEYASCAGPRSMPMTRPTRTINEDNRHLYTETYYHHGSNLRFKPYSNVKERYPQTRYEYVNNYPNPFHPPPPFPQQKYDFQKSVSAHPSYPQVPVKYMENRINDSVMDGYQRSNQQINYNVQYQNQMIHPVYGPMLTNSLPNKFYQYPPDSPIKAVPANKLPYDNSKLYLEHESSRNKGYSAPENFYMNEMVRPHMKSQVLMPNYPPMNMQPITHPYYRKESHSSKGYEYIPHFRHVDPMGNNHMNKMMAQFSPNAIAISPSDSSISNDTAHTLSNSLEDFGYVSQSSNASARSVESGTNRIMPSDIHRRYNYGYPSMVRTSPMSSKLHSNSNNNTNSKDVKGIDVRQFLQMWNEGDEESANNQRENVTQIDYNHNPSKSTSYCEGKTQEQLYVLGLVNVPSEELGKYEHIQKVSKLPDNIKGYNNIELLKHFEEAIESSNLNHFNMRKTPTPRHFQSSKPLMMPGTLIPNRPVSPLDVESKISQSVIHKEVGCNFEIKPCSPQMLNVEVATPAQNILEERAIEKVCNPYKSPSISNIPDNGRNCNKTKQEQVMMLNESVKIPSCKLINTQCSNNDVVNAIRADYSLQDLESNAGVCFASLPRLDIELNFPEVNQQFINANKESVITSQDSHKSSDVNSSNFNNDTNDNDSKSNINTKTTPRDSDKEFLKLSKYRKNKKVDPDSRERQSITNSQFLRTDSVIIKNPENTKCYDNSPDYLPNVKYTDKVEHNSKCFSPLNMLETNIELPKIDDIVEEPVNEIAVDFSLNKSENISTIEINKNNANENNNLDTRCPENMPVIEKNMLECNENTEHLVSYKVTISTKSCNETVNDRVCENVPISLSDNKPYSAIIERNVSEFIQIENVSQELTQNLDENNDEIPGSCKSFESLSQNDKNEVSAEDVNEISNHSRSNDPYFTTFFNETEHNNVSSDSNDKIDKDFSSDFPSMQLTIGHDKSPVQSVSISDSDKTIASVEFYSETDSYLTAQIDKNSSHETPAKNEEDIVHKSEIIRNSFPHNVSADIDKNETDNIVVDTAYDSFATEPDILIEIQNKKTNEQKTCIVQKFKETDDVTSQNSAVVEKDKTLNVQKSEINDIQNVVENKKDSAYEPVSTESNIAIKVQENESHSNSQHQYSAENDEDNRIIQHSEKISDDICKKYSATINLYETAHCNTLEDSACKSYSSEPDIASQIANNESDSSLRNDSKATHDNSACKNLDSNINDLVSTEPDIETQTENNEVNSGSHHWLEAVNGKDISVFHKSEKYCDYFSQNCSAVINETDHSETDNSANESGSTIETQIKNDESDSDAYYQSEKTMYNKDISIVSELKEECDHVQNCAPVIDEEKTAQLTILDDSAYESITTEHDIANQIDNNQLSLQHQSNNKNEYKILCKSKIVSGEVFQNVSADLDEDANSNTLKHSACESVTLDYQYTCKRVITKYHQSHDCNLRKELFSPWIQKLILWSEGHTFRSESLVENTSNFYNAPHNSLVLNCSDVTKKITTNIEDSLIEGSDFSSNVIETNHFNPINKELLDTLYDTKSEYKSNDSSLKENKAISTSEVDDLSKTINIEEKVVEDTKDIVKIATKDSQVVSNHEEIIVSNSFLEASGEIKFKCDFEKRRLTLKRSLSESAIDMINTDISENFRSGPAWTKKRRKNNELLQVYDSPFIADGASNTQNNRRNSISSIYNEDKLSFCIVIENDCIINQENEEEKICYAEISEDCISEIQAHIIEEDMAPATEIIICPEEDNCQFSEPFVLEMADEKSLEQSWVDDIGCVETVVSDDIAEDVTISVPPSPKEEDILENDDSGIFNNTYEHTDKVKYIYGGKMCNDDAEFVETLYRTPQMNVNKTLFNRESHVSDNFEESDESNALEDYFKSNVEYSSKSELLATLDSDTNLSCLASKDDDNSLKSPEVISFQEQNSSRNYLVTHDEYLINSALKETFKANDVKMDFFHKKINNQIEYFDKHIEMGSNIQSIEKNQDDTVNSCESSIDNVLSYNQDSDSMVLDTPSSPEVSSTTSEEKSSSILLKITNYKGLRTSQLNESNIDNNCSNCCKFTENINYINCNNSSKPRPLITKAAQKYIPPIEEPLEDLKVKLPLPHQSLLKLKQLKIENTEKKHIGILKKEVLVKPKPRFEDVLKSIDEIQFKMHKDKTKRPKKAVPKVVIKKTENGSHYASVHKKDFYDPDLTGRKWQPWVFIEKNNFIDKMAIKKKTKAIFNHRKNTYVFAEKFQKYKSVSSAKFVITQPKLDDKSVGQLKYTIRLKHTY